MSAGGTTHFTLGREDRSEKNVGTSALSVADPCVSGLMRVGYTVAALAFFLLGLAGVVLPGLPTTPFLLLTSFFLARCSPKWNRILLRSKFFGPILSDWHQRGGIRPSVKVKARIVVVMAVTISLALGSFSIGATGLIVALAATGLLTIQLLPVIR